MVIAPHFAADYTYPKNMYVVVCSTLEYGKACMYV